MFDFCFEYNRIFGFTNFGCAVWKIEQFKARVIGSTYRVCQPAAACGFEYGLRIVNARNFLKRVSQNPAVGPVGGTAREFCVRCYLTNGPSCVTIVLA